MATGGDSGDDEGAICPDWIFAQSKEEEDRTTSLGSGGGQEKTSLVLTDPLTVRRVYSLGRDISAFLEKRGIFYWSSSGTTLGIVRHGGLIPWDDDLDICVREGGDSERLWDSRGELEAECGLVIEVAESVGFRISRKTTGGEEGYPFCDVFVMILEEGWYEPVKRLAAVLWPQERYRSEDVDASSARGFGDFLLTCPRRPEDYLTRNYGPDWRSAGRAQEYDHRKKNFLPRRPDSFPLDSALLEPAKPFR